MSKLRTVARDAKRAVQGRRPPRFVSANPSHSKWLAEQMWDGEYDEPGFVPEKGWRVLDIGANVGTFAVRSALRGAQVVAIEPHPETFRYLQMNARHRGVDCRQAAVVAEEPASGQVALFLGTEDTRHSLSDADAGSGSQLSDHVMVPTIAGGSLLSESWDLAKIDCEGAEFAIFGALTDDTLRDVRRLVVEVHGDEPARTDFVAALERAGYRVSVRRLPEPLLALCFAVRE